MTFTEYDMYPVTRQLLRSYYKASDGWEILEQPHGGTYIPDFVAQRRTWNNQIEKVVVEVKAECRVRQAHIDQLNGYARNLAGPNVQIAAKLLVFPSGSDISLATRLGITVHKLSTFKCV